MTTYGAANLSLLSLTPLAPTSIPPPTAPPQQLHTFFASLLSTAASLQSEISPPVWRPGRTFRSSAPSSSSSSSTTTPIPEVRTFRSVRTAASPATGRIHTEYWVARRSIHTPPPPPPSPSFAVFEAGLLKNHARQELEYIPTVTSVEPVSEYKHMLLEGDRAGAEVEAGVYDVRHKMPWPLWPRVFRVLVVTGRGLCVSVPVEVSQEELDEDENENEEEGEQEEEKKKKKKKKKVVRGVYVAVEKIVEGTDGETEWTVATAADAKGWIPKFLQRWMMPKTVVKDVGSFLEWAARRRRAEEEEVEEVV